MIRQFAEAIGRSGAELGGKGTEGVSGESAAAYTGPLPEPTAAEKQREQQVSRSSSELGAYLDALEARDDEHETTDASSKSSWWRSKL